MASAALQREAGRSHPELRTRSGPRISVVVVSSAPYDGMRSWLRRLHQLCATNEVELVLVRGDELDDEKALSREFPQLRFAAYSVNDAPSASALRGAGMRVATGDLVIFTRDGEDRVFDQLESLLVGACALRSVGGASA